MKKRHNFSAGPAAIPHEVLCRAREELVDFGGYGLSLLELSHRGEIYQQVHQRCIALFAEVLRVPHTHQVLLLAGGATLQFGMAPLNLLHERQNRASIAISGAWASKAYSDLQKVSNTVHVAFDGAEQGYTNLPSSLEVPEDCVYLHLCSNETINGVQWADFPRLSCPIVADMSSDLLSRSLDWDKFAVVYAGSQKNLGPAGLCLVVVRKDLLSQCRPDLPAYLRYSVHATSKSLYNTPPGFAVYMVLLQLEWLQQLGGLAEIQQQNARKAAQLYRTIDESQGFYQNLVIPSVRSQMNVPFLLADCNLEAAFLAEAEEWGMEGLKGHRSVGGMRASIYNAVRAESVDLLCQLMQQFQRSHS